MTEHAAAPAVALLFADAELSAHLRQALVALGARIVHEGPATTVDRQVLADSGAEVVVINLDAEAEEHLDRLYEALDQDTQRVVFNDAQVSRGLSGWDQARWARHLAVKLLGRGDVDPPRPADARAVEARPAATPTAAAEDARDLLASTAVELPHAGDIAQPPGDQASAGSADADALAAELEALLAEGEELLGIDDDTAAGDDSAEQAITPAAAEGDADTGAPSPADPAPPAASDAPESPSCLPELGLVDVDAPPLESASPSADESLAIEQRQTVPAPPPVSADWGLVDFDAAPPAPPTTPAPETAPFGVEKMAAADYLAPEGGDHESPLEPGLGLELVSMEEAIAPVASDAPINEMILDDSGGGIRRVVVLGAAAQGAAAVAEFLSALPPVLPALLVLVQHQGDTRADELQATLGATTPLPIRLAANDIRARQGEVLLLPAGQACQIARDGRVSLGAGTAQPPCDPSIDQCFTAAADAFGPDVLAILLAGKGNDAVAGVQAVRDRGGRVWAQGSAVDDGDAMAAVAAAEGLVDFTGTPTELAARLREEYA